MACGQEPSGEELELARERVQEDHADDWLQDVLDGFGEDDYIIFDCPGQVPCTPCCCVFGAYARLSHQPRAHSRLRLTRAD
jgi:hypothetical protein